MPPRLYIAKSGAEAAPTLPLDAVTRTFAVLGQRGTGKTNTAVVLAEEMARKGGHVAVLDPVGAWYGITRRGEKKGIEGIVIGGEYGDVPLEETGGQLVAELVIGRHYPVVVIDLKLLRKGAQLRFMADYLEALFHANREPLCQVFEEADRALPQQGRGSFDVTAARVLGAGEDIVKLGRSRGLGAVLVTQRAATLNKNALEVCESLLLHRMMGPNDRKAIKGWVESNGDPDALKMVMDSMASLKRGEAWLYSPGWLSDLKTPILKDPRGKVPRHFATGLARLRLRHRQTFDSSATPEIGQTVADPGARAPVDLEALREQMADTVERAKANDPTELRRRIAALERLLADSEPEVEEREVEVLVPDAAAVAEFGDAVTDLRAACLDAAAVAEQVTRAAEGLTGAASAAAKSAAFVDQSLDQARALPERQRVEKSAVSRPGGELPAPAREGQSASPTSRPVGESPPVRPSAGAGRPSAAPRPANSNGSGPDVTGPMQRVLDSLAWWVSVGVGEPTKQMVAVVAGYHERTKSYTNALGTLNSGGWIVYGPRSTLALDVKGAEAAHWPERPGTSEELQQRVLEQVGGVRARVLAHLLNHGEMDRAELAEALGYHERTKSFTNALGSLHSLGFVEQPERGRERAADMLYLVTA